MVHTPETSAFLTAEWRHLLMLNYEVAPAILAGLVPPGTELDTFNGVTYVSVVGFMFLRTRVLGVGVPFHQDFEEVNLRFYVRRGDRRGVVFVREIVPRAAIAAVARHVYNEKYLALPMRHTVSAARVAYEWRLNGDWNRVAGRPQGTPQPLQDGSIEAFITEHYWGYTAGRRGGCTQYEVAHPRWNVQPVAEPELHVDIERLYGTAFVPFLTVQPASAFLADGSEVTVYRGSSL